MTRQTAGKRIPAQENRKSAPSGHVLSRLWQTFIRSAFPPRCQQCGEYMHPPFADEAEGRDIRKKSYEQIMAPCLCAQCLPDYRPVQSPICPVCGMMNKDRSGKNRICENCLILPRHFRRCRSFGTYERGLKTLVRNYKYSGKISLAKPLGLLLFTVFAENWLPEECDLLLPVPLHKNRYRQRGFNQSWLLIRQWPDWIKKYHLPFSRLDMDSRNLVRIRATRTQTNMSREMRRSNVRNAFRLRWPEKVAGKKIVLADDVFTTGTTADECARILMEAGAVQTDVITIAQTLRYSD